MLHMRRGAFGEAPGGCVAKMFSVLIVGQVPLSDTFTPSEKLRQRCSARRVIACCNMPARSWAQHCALLLLHHDACSKMCSSGAADVTIVHK